MKSLLTIFAGIFLIGSITAQSLKSEKCTWQDCVLIPYSEYISKGFTGVSLQSINTGRKVTKLSDLNDKEVKKIKKSMRAFKSCTVYVDLEHVLISSELNPNLSENDLSFLIVLETEKN